ncbi:aldehyde dehydrogenase family protein [Sphingobacterium detergens]|uniref:Acyl-CoA reductase-like NAD-dependent aldehyde dehydrogenase n=1 Tax=Sphingobacterium detergens TaxID=1145106 RepID=A0A420BKE2_SPHD1|nr:aldehyde dehydrogenase family protein [Sphingobacterium detergens]RKE57095.1 acyl-CoA reductase-like NAD-dependent aldehyde dehydrogenase [Sphingobacterium detergens]
MEKIALNWINGEWIDSGSYKDSFNPATGEKIGVYADGGSIEAEKAIAAAKEAHKKSGWRHDRYLRYKAINELADAFENNTERLKEILMLENGKVAAEALFEISLVAPKMRYYAAQALTEFGRALETKPGKFSMVLAESIGVAGIIAPWNSPIILMIRSLAPALAAGCTAVIKMPGQTAQVNLAINEIMASVTSLPKGVINQFTESGSAGAALMVESPDVPTISYTGSTPTGRILMRNGAANLKRFGFELGGKTPMLVFDDANLDLAVPTLEKAITVFAGQFCMTGSRILVQRGIAESLITKLSQRLQDVKVGPASDPTSDMGPVIDKANAERIDAVVEKAILEGAEVLVRGGKINTGSLASGAFYRPTLLKVSVQDNKLDIIQKETFGPVATVQIFDSPEEAIALANDSEFGLAASVWSQDVDLPLKVVRELEAGTVWINNWAVVNDEFEEGGYKMSGLGRLNGLAAIHDFVEFKHIFHATGIL